MFSCHGRMIREERQAFPVMVVSIRPSTRDYRTLIAGAVLVVLPLHPLVHTGGISILLETI
ncbi:hypothetical protein CCS01_18605 [Rhodopila globiformis]|uniref:Uncharacterized protein n=2 Tax=Rhodopila globiformis TaxID=1071 RepID=A0A2S6N882_RHOGL|nr:hypothetical protein CCS01_18605 [Rhodopila globiformis]